MTFGAESALQSPSPLAVVTFVQHLVHPAPPKKNRADFPSKEGEMSDAHATKESAREYGILAPEEVIVGAVLPAIRAVHSSAAPRDDSIKLETCLKLLHAVVYAGELNPPSDSDSDSDAVQILLAALPLELCLSISGTKPI